MSFMNYLSEDYSDIIDMPHHEPTRKPRMPIGKRAAQFKAFIPFSGYMERIKEMGKNQRIEGDSYYVTDEEYR